MISANRKKNTTIIPVNSKLIPDSINVLPVSITYKALALKTLI